MRQALLFSVILIALFGCTRNTKEICNETNELLTRFTGKGFTDVGMIGCLKQTPEEAEYDLASIKRHFDETPLKSRDELKETLSKGGPIAFIGTYGNPDEHRSFNSKNGNKYETEDMDEILLKLASEADGVTLMKWYRPLSADVFGRADHGIFIAVQRYNGELVTQGLVFPEYFWEKWLK